MYITTGVTTTIMASIKFVKLLECVCVCVSIGMPTNECNCSVREFVYKYTNMTSTCELYLYGGGAFYYKSFV